VLGFGGAGWSDVLHDDDARGIQFQRVEDVQDVAWIAKVVAGAELDGLDAISFEHQSSGYQQGIDAMLAEHGVSLRVVQQTDNGETALALVGVGLGITLLHLLIAPSAHGDVVFVSLPDDAPESEFGAIWRRDDVHPLRGRFLETIASVAHAGYAPVGAHP